jgi:hypothetical protein
MAYADPTGTGHIPHPPMNARNPFRCDAQL